MNKKEVYAIEFSPRGQNNWKLALWDLFIHKQEATQRLYQLRAYLKLAKFRVSKYKATLTKLEQA